MAPPAAPPSSNGYRGGGNAQSNFRQRQNGVQNNKSSNNYGQFGNNNNNYGFAGGDLDTTSSSNQNAIQDQFLDAETRDEIDARMGFPRYSAGPSRVGWLINMHPTIVRDEEWPSGRAACDYYFLDESGSSFKSTVVFSPYFLLVVEARCPVHSFFFCFLVSDSRILDLNRTTKLEIFVNFFFFFISTERCIWRSRGMSEASLRRHRGISFMGSKGRPCNGMCCVFILFPPVNQVFHLAYPESYNFCFSLK
jgi:hypothetical protein